MARSLTVALAGNPNCGKSTLFNALTGSRQHVGNYPGVTVAKVQGRAENAGRELSIVDLPGTYSLTAYSTDEVVARNELIDSPPDVVINVVDADNLERNLYLTIQLIELGVPLVLGLNKIDLAHSHGWSIDVARLSRLLGVPVVPIVASRSHGLRRLLDVAARTADAGRAAVDHLALPGYGSVVHPFVEDLAKRVAAVEALRPHARWFAVKLIEADPQTLTRIRRLAPQHADAIGSAADACRRGIQSTSASSAEIVLANRRYEYIAGLCSQAVTRTHAPSSFSDRLDAVLTNRFLGLPIFALMMYLTFQLTFSLGNPLVHMLDGVKESLATAVRSLDPSGTSLLVSLAADGVIDGVGAVLAFVPLIALLYLAIAILEDSGYMARAAFVLDSLMHHIGLHGKSFIPMVIGFGCTVPAIYATRILDSRRDRLTTMLALPLFSCGARLPVYVLMLGAFFPARMVFRPLGLTNQALLLFAIYALGIALAIAAIKILRATILRGEHADFVMELPPYRAPALRPLLAHSFERTWEYIRKAGTIILAISIVLWALKTWPTLPAEQVQAVKLEAQAQHVSVDVAVHRAQLAHSAIGRLGHDLEYVLKPTTGFDWKISTALLGSLAAKEVFVSQMGIIYAVNEHPAPLDAAEGSAAAPATLTQHLAADYSPLVGLCIMVFVLISSPCMATVAATIRESGSWKWAVLQWSYLTLLAWGVATALYHTATALGWTGQH